MKTSTPKPSRKGQPKESSKMIMQGYGLTAAKYKANLYQKRMMLAVASAAQSKIEGERHIAGRRIRVKDGEFPIISAPMDLILQDDDSSNIYAVRKAAKDFVGRVIEYEDNEGNWTAFSPFVTITTPRQSSTLEVQVHKLFWEAILDYRSGYRKIDVKRAIALKSVYAIRFFELFSGKTEPITYSLVDLKKMFSIEKKYKQVNDFVRFVLEPAKRELDASAPYSFTYKPIKDGRKIIGFTFFPVHYPQRDDREAETRDLQRKLNLSWDIRDRHARDYLLNSIGFTEVELKNNIELFRRASELLPDFLNELAILKGKSRDKINPKGWIIRSLEGKVKDYLEDLKKNSTLPEIEDIAKRFSSK